MQEDALSSLPFELRFLILSSIPPTQLFTLRRVSQAWNQLLRDPTLLEAINKRLPFLSSAHGLASRLKRRMRMQRGESVWVTPVEELCLWVKGW